MTLSERLGQFIAGLHTSDLPLAVVETAKLRLLDLLGVGLAGYRLGLYRPLLGLVDEGFGDSTIWGEGSLVSTRAAATINSLMAHSTYLEDGCRSTGGHPSSAIIPAILSLGEARRISGEELLPALVAGYELFIRIGAAIYPSTVTRGFQPTAILASLGAAAGCAKILKLNGQACGHALAIAANLGSGLKSALREPSSQPIQVGRSCEGGILAAMMASRDLKGYPGCLESFLVAHAETPEPQAIADDLGDAFAIEETYLKVHGGCRGNHAPVDVVLKIMEEQQPPVDQIERIVIGIDSVTAAAEIHWPSNGKEAQFSIAFSVALALLERTASLFQFTDERVEDPAIRDLMNRVVVEVDPEMDGLLPVKRGARAAMIMRDGRCYRDSLEIARGEPESPLATEQVEAKFRDLSQEVLGDRARRVIDCIRRLEEVPTIKELTALLKAR